MTKNIELKIFSLLFIMLYCYCCQYFVAMLSHFFAKIVNCFEQVSVQILSYFWSIFSFIQTEYRDLRSKIQSEYRKIRTRNNPVFRHFSRSEGPGYTSVTL